MANKISVLIDVTTDKANRALSGFKKSISDADGAVGKFKAGTSSAFASLKANAVPIAAAAGAAIVTFGAKAVAAASDLEQSVGGVEKAFGDSAEAVLALGENAETSMGLSKRAFNEGALALSAFADDIANDTGKPVAKVIEELMTRAADFAAAYGTTVPEAVRIFSSTLSGESEPIKRFGIIVNETETSAYAAEAGIEDMGKATQRAGLLMRDTSKFAGQFADESDTLAGQQERLGAEFENMTAEIGEKLLPVVAEAAQTIRNLMSVVEGAEDTANDLGFSLGTVADAADWLGKAPLKMLGSNIGRLRDEIDDLTGSTDDAAVAFDGQSQRLVQASIDAALAGRSTKDLEAATASNADRAAEAAEAAEDLAKAHEDLSDTFDDVIGKIEELTEAQGDLVGAEVDLERATLDYQDAMISARMVIDSTESSERDRTEAVLDAKDAIRDQAEALADNEIATREANGEVLTASEKNAILAKHYRDLADDAIPEAASAARRWADDLDDIPDNVTVLVRGDTAAARRQAQEYINKLGGIPGSTRTTIMALIDQGRINAAERALNNAARDRFSTIRVNVSGGQLVRSGQVGFRAKGGPVQAGKPYVVGEEGPELITPKSGGMVHSAKKTAKMIGGGGGNNITINMPAGTRPEAVINAQRRYSRIQATQI